MDCLSYARKARISLASSTHRTFKEEAKRSFVAEFSRKFDSSHVQGGSQTVFCSLREPRLLDRMIASAGRWASSLNIRLFYSATSRMCETGYDQICVFRKRESPTTPDSWCVERQVHRNFFEACASRARRFIESPQPSRAQVDSYIERDLGEKTCSDVKSGSGEGVLGAFFSALSSVRLATPAAKKASRKTRKKVGQKLEKSNES